MNSKYACWLFNFCAAYFQFILFKNPFYREYSVLIYVSGPRTLTKETFLEEIIVKENTLNSFRFQPKAETSNTSKDSVFIIEFKLSENENNHVVCRCRWIFENTALCKVLENVAICNVYNSEILLSLVIKRTQRDIMWELYRHNSASHAVKLTSPAYRM